MHAATFISTGGNSSHRNPSENEQILMEEMVELANKRIRENGNAKVGLVESRSISKVFSDKGLKITPDEVKGVFNMVEAHHKRLQNEESSTMPCVVVDVAEEIREKARAAMRVYDRNRDNKVSKAEMKTVSGSRLSDEAIQMTFAKHDANADGKLDLKEMTSLIKEKYNA